MNKAERAALADKATLVDIIAALITLRTQWSPTDRALEIIDTVLAVHGVSEPGADAAEAAAKAMYNQSPEVWFSTQVLPYPSWDKAPTYVKAGARIMSRAALAAVHAVPEPDADAVDRVKAAIRGVLKSAWEDDDEKLIYPCDIDAMAHAAITAMSEALLSDEVVEAAVKAAHGEVLGAEEFEDDDSFHEMWVGYVKAALTAAIAALAVPEPDAEQGGGQR